ncbi:MAG: 4-hydroxy-tetrahydrodipicolinate reductase [Desulfovibrio sp.]
MQTRIVVMGAAGRMGTMISRQVREDSALVLAGRVETASRLGELASLEGCVDGGDIDTVLSQVKDAVIVDFTAPALSLATARAAVKHGARHVIGTTGLTREELDELEDLAKKTPIFWSPNMSVGVSVLAKILPELARLLGEGYDMEMVEIHHNKKKDSPSGTAIRLAEGMASARDWRLDDVACYHREGIVGERPHKEIGMQAVRGGDVVGIHTAYFLGQGERIEVTHHAHSRENFAQGALRAAKWLAHQEAKKLYLMDDIF